LRTPYWLLCRSRASSVDAPGAPRDLRPGGLGLPDVVLPAASGRWLPRAGDEGDHEARLKLGAHLDGEGCRDMRPVDHLEHLRPIVGEVPRTSQDPQVDERREPP